MVNETVSKKWLITGGCGFIGRNLVKTLLEKGGNFIRVVDNLSVGTREDLEIVGDVRELSSEDIAPPPDDIQTQPVELAVGDILDDAFAIKVSKGFDIIVHLAANTGVAPSVEDPVKDCKTNVIGTLNYLEAARLNGVKRFIFASSGAPIGECEPPIHEELPARPVSPYGASKLAGEGYCSAYHRTFGLETVALRFGNVYGPLSGKKDSVVAKFIKRAIHGEPLEIYGDGTQTRDFIYVEDLIDAILKAALFEDNAFTPWGESFQIATNSETTVSEVVDILLPLLQDYGIEGSKVIHRGKRKGDVKRNYSDISKARSILGFESRYDLPLGLKLTMDWFLKEQISSIKKPDLNVSRSLSG